MAGTNKVRYGAQAKLHKALAHSTRLFIVEEVSKHERCVHELATMVGAEMPTVSRHLSILKEAGILEDEKRGSHVFYRLKTPCVMSFFRCNRNVQRAANQRETGFTEVSSLVK